MAALWLTSSGASTAVALGAVTGTTVSLTTSANPVLLSNPVTLQATIASDVGAPSGSIDFYDGAQLLGSATVNAAGVGTLVGSFGSTGTHSLTTVYSGSGSFGGTSAAVLEVVEDFGLSPPVMLDNNTCECHLAVGTSIYLFSLGPLGGATLPSAIQLAVSGLPAGTTATLAPVAIAAGAGATPVTLTLQREPGTSQLRQWGMYGAVLSLLLPLSLIGHRRRAGRALRVGRLAVWALVLAGLGSVVGCGGSGGASAATASSGSGAANYSLTITATGGLLLHTVILTVATL